MRTSIGSGLLQLGIKPGAGVGLYSVNCKGLWWRTRGFVVCCWVLRGRLLFFPISLQTFKRTKTKNNSQT